jgi:mono/diheme cytochrome c family protein
MEEKTWPRTENEMTLLAELSDSALRSDPSDRTDFVEFAGQLATDSDARASLLISRIRVVQRLDKDSPVPIKLAAAPETWLSAAKSDSSLADSLTKSAMYFDWPGRPAVDRPRRVGPLSTEDLSRYNRGKDLYTACAACHQPEGKGAPGLAPSLIGSSIVLGPEDTLAKILLRGLEGEYEFDGEMYGGVMPAAVFPDDGEYAAVMTYIRRAFGNSADPVHPDIVERVRAATSGQTVPYSRKDIDAGK